MMMKPKISSHFVQITPRVQQQQLQTTTTTTMYRCIQYRGNLLENHMELQQTTTMLLLGTQLYYHQMVSLLWVAVVVVQLQLQL